MKIDVELQREIILAELRSLPFSGVEVRLRALPPPHLGWLIEVNEQNLQEFSDSKREDVLMALLDIVNNLNRLGVSAGIVRAPSPDTLVTG